MEIQLDPGETVVAEAGAMSWMDDGIRWEAVLGDGTRPPRDFWDAALGAGKRLLTGESLFLTNFTNTADSRRVVAFAAPYPGKIVPLDLGALGGELICQKDSFLCAAKGTVIDIAFTRSIAAGLFGGEGFILQRLRGDGWTFAHAGGVVVQKELTGGKLLVDTGCIVAFTTGIRYDVRQAGDLKSMLFGGEGLFLAELEGTGTVWMQSLPFSRLARRVLRQVGRPGKALDERSILGSLGNILMGGNR